MIAVGVVPLADPEQAVKEAREAIRLGCGAIWVGAAPAGERSPGHPDLDPFWALLQETGTPFMLHVGAASVVQPPAFDRLAGRRREHARQGLRRPELCAADVPDGHGLRWRVRPFPEPARWGDRAGRRLGGRPAAAAGPRLEGLEQDRPVAERAFH